MWTDREKGKGHVLLTTNRELTLFNYYLTNTLKTALKTRNMFLSLTKAL